MVPDLPRVGLVKILFVCLGNICRSPAAEGVMTKLVTEAGLEQVWEIDSAGTIGMHAGNPADVRMQTAARKRGVALTSRARQIWTADLDRFDLILAMDRSNFGDIGLLAGKSRRAEVALFCEFCTRHREIEVPDPYYGGPEGFEKVLDLLEDGCAEILRLWREEKRWNPSTNA
ncbi:MAG: protein-tyrosine phosphatase [Verrucomicrobia bacterium]|jgi:protein-tyrosine phosphatase|nr:MAG: protein-tyrosine phosphatase [Verrucomicrobiota bacterium]